MFYPIRLVYESDFCVAQRCEYAYMKGVARLEFESISCAILG